ncbi:BspA family leucine-rich repeat surface protein, partial [Enterococcus faecalis]|nr:BspA family leucine-rich repeat surface protein [Enterococcus faecalis]
TRKKQILTLFATTSMTLNMVVSPLSSLAESNDISDDDTVSNLSEINIDLPMLDIKSDTKYEKELIDYDEVAENSDITKDIIVVNDDKETETEQLNDTETKVETLSGTYENNGKWTFEQNNGVLILSGGMLSEPIGRTSWLQKLSKENVREIYVIDAVGKEDLDNLFRDYSNVQKITFNNFDTSQVISMHAMFRGCSGLTKLDLSSLNTNKVSNMYAMFYECSNLVELNLNNINTSQVTTMRDMFRGCSSLKNLNLSGFDISKVRNMYAMFYGCSSLAELDLSHFNTSQVISMEYMFRGCSSLEKLDLSSFDTSQVTSMDSMFYGCSNLIELDLSHFDTSQVISMRDMFRGCNSLTELDVSSFDTSNVIEMYAMFYGCSSLSELDLNNFDTSQVTGIGISSMFYGCTSLKELNISNFNTSQMTHMWGTFAGCNSLTEINLKNFDTRQVIDMGYMFYDCSSLKKLDLSSFTTSNVTNMEAMFQNCSNLIELGLSNFDTNSVSTMQNMFLNCNLEKLILGSATRFSENTSLREVPQGSFWYGQLSKNQLDSTTDLIMYHNTLNESNTYILMNHKEETLTLTFDTIGGNLIAPVETTYGNFWVEPTAPTKEGYVFDGWYVDISYTKEFDFSKEAKVSTTVYAKWVEETIFEVDEYYIGDYNITGRFSAPIVTAQLRINGSISNKGGTFNQNDGTFYYYAGAGRIQTGQEVVLEGLDKSGNIVETVNIEPKVAEGTLSNVQHTVGSSTITGTYTGEISKARLVVNGNIISVGGTFKDGTFSYYVAPNQVKETDTVQLQGYDKEGNPVGDLTPVTIQKQQGQLTEAIYKLGQSTITGAYEGNVKKARLLVDGKQISWGGTFKDGTFSYYVAPGTIKADSTVELAVYGEGDVPLSQENFFVTVAN